MATTPPQSARRNYHLSALIARRAVREARKARSRGVPAVAGVIAAHQLANAQTSSAAVGQMLADQGIDSAADAAVNLLTFTTTLPTIEQMLADIERKASQLLEEAARDSQTYIDASFARLVDSLVQDAARAAESVAVAARPNIYHVRYISPPCCSRCAILAGRVYRWSTGFQRHPGCDCSMIPTSVASPLRQDPEQLVADGLVRGLSKADLRAIEDGADLGRVVNIRQQASSLLDAGHSLRRGGRPTPAAIYRRFPDDRERAVAELKRFGYLR